MRYRSVKYRSIVCVIYCGRDRRNNIWIRDSTSCVLEESRAKKEPDHKAGQVDSCSSSSQYGICILPLESHDQLLVRTSRVSHARFSCGK